MKLPRPLLIASLVMLVVRVLWVWRFREIDSDAYGHFFIAVAARRDPGNLNVHWVWLPLFHFVVGGLTAVGLTFHGLRYVNAVLAGIAPLLLWGALRRRDGEQAMVAATAFAIAPLTTILGQSAQPETLFLLFIVASIHAAARDWPSRAGIWLALACMVRYEAWGAALALAIHAAWLIGHRRPESRARAIHAAIPCAVVALYILFRWHTDGTLLLFFRGTRDITKVQVAREAWSFRALVDFPIILPCVILGPAVLALPFGVRRGLDANEKALALGFAAFLLLSYYSGGSHSGERYLISLTPFAYAAIGYGGQRDLRERQRDLRERVPSDSLGRRFGQLCLLCVALTTIWHLDRAGHMALDWEDGLRAREEELNRVLVTAPK